ncbi:MAG: ABC transporter [Spirochaetes bacterium]|nr:MAG: ABC transporter [Spirochaetota bacterium]
MNNFDVELKNVSVIREDFNVLKNITLSFPSGKTSIIMGPSGCGKSTLLKVASGIIPPDEGKVFIFGKDTFKITDNELIIMRKKNGFVFQDAALWANKTIYQNLSLPLEFHFRNFSSAEIKRRIDYMLSKIGYRESTSLRPAQLSSGECKMISFARALITEPQLIFMDTPTANMDSEAADRILNIIKELKYQKKTIIVNTHNPILTSMVADYLIVMKAGSIIEEGEFSKVVRSKNREVSNILSDVLSKTATYDTDILDLLSTDQQGGDII